MTNGDWPTPVPCRRYRVRFKCRETESDYTVATHYGAEKAVAMATERHLGRFPREEDVRRHIDCVTVADLGPVARDERGVMQPQSRDLVDRAEW